MNTPLQIGDRVQWRPKYRQKKTPEIMTGVVRSIHQGRKPWAGIAVTGPRGGNWCVDLDRLTVVAPAGGHAINNTALVAAIAAQPQDDADRESAIAELRDEVHDQRQGERREAGAVASLGVICTDYEAQMEYGDYGGREG